jgi:hypothetical protein
MKSVKIIVFVSCAIAVGSAGSARTRFHGEVSDTQCAMNIHSLERSHAEMIAKGTLGNDAASCAKACVRRGGEWVLRSGDNVYRLKNQAGLEQFAGEEVNVAGTLEKKTNTIDNIEIVPTPADKQTQH